VFSSWLLAALGGGCGGGSTRISDFLRLTVDAPSYVLICVEPATRRGTAIEPAPL